MSVCAATCLLAWPACNDPQPGSLAGVTSPGPDTVDAGHDSGPLDVPSDGSDTVEEFPPGTWPSSTALYCDGLDDAVVLEFAPELEDATALTLEMWLSISAALAVLIFRSPKGDTSERFQTL